MSTSEDNFSYLANLTNEAVGNELSSLTYDINWSYVVLAIGKVDLLNASLFEQCHNDNRLWEGSICNKRLQ